MRASVAEREEERKNRYSLWMACQDTSALEISALMPSPVPRQKCWHVGVGVCCKGTIWRSSMRLESQCAFFYHLLTLARECNGWVESSNYPGDDDNSSRPQDWKTFDLKLTNRELSTHSTRFNFSVNAKASFHTREAPLERRKCFSSSLRPGFWNWNNQKEETD